MSRFEGKTAVVTGGAMGLGAAVCRRLAEEGARIVIVDIDAEQGPKTAAGLPGDADHHFIEADLSHAEAIEPLVAAIGAASDGVDVLVNNAGISIEEPFEQISEAHWDRQIAINLRSPLLLIKALIPLMRDRSAAIVNVSSEVAFHPRPEGTIYDITKAAMGGLTRSLAAELWKYGIRVNEMAPGGMVTEMHFAKAEDPAATKSELEGWELPEEWSVMRRLGLPDEVAPTIAFLASEDARFITGSTLHVDGGQGVG
ncbi:MAG TPA: SDR family oxidoreductase [Solirubrobacterales bacterium]|nr:SDR family oxidoreductase [Solirubrobacterales bacterium]